METDLRELDVKVKLEVINNGYLVTSPSGVEFKKNLVDAVAWAQYELGFWVEEKFVDEEDIDKLSEYLGEKLEATVAVDHKWVKEPKVISPEEHKQMKKWLHSKT